MKIRLAYGKEGIEVEVPDDATIVEPRFVAGIADEAAALRDAMRSPISAPPLAARVKAGFRGGDWVSHLYLLIYCSAR